jgi:hypothetical protein
MRDSSNSPFKILSERDRRCKEKNSVICPILEGIEIKAAKLWKAILMPCLHGPEISILLSKGIPRKNIVAIERDPDTWEEIRDRHAFDMGHGPLEANEAIDHIYAAHEDGFNLIYLDFFSRPTFSHLQMLQKIFSFGLIRKGGKLILTFGKGRCRTEVRDMNNMLLKNGEILPTRTEILAAAEISRHRSPRWMRDHEYKSSAGGNKVIHYITTEAQF